MVDNEAHAAFLLVPRFLVTKDDPTAPTVPLFCRKDQISPSWSSSIRDVSKSIRSFKRSFCFLSAVYVCVQSLTGLTGGTLRVLEGLTSSDPLEMIHLSFTQLNNHIHQSSARLRAGDPARLKPSTTGANTRSLRFMCLLRTYFYSKNIWNILTHIWGLWGTKRTSKTFQEHLLILLKDFTTFTKF